MLDLRFNVLLLLGRYFYWCSSLGSQAWNQVNLRKLDDWGSLPSSYYWRKTNLLRYWDPQAIKWFRCKHRSNCIGDLCSERQVERRLLPTWSWLNGRWFEGKHYHQLISWWYCCFHRYWQRIGEMAVLNVKRKRTLWVSPNLKVQVAWMSYDLEWSNFLPLGGIRICNCQP